MSPEGFSRRAFFKNLSMLCASSAAIIPGWADAGAVFLIGSSDSARDTMKAFADTIIPGPYSDPEGSVGGVESGGVEILYDPDYGLRPFIGLLSGSLNLTSYIWYRKSFQDLDAVQRTELVLFNDSRPGTGFLYEQAENLVKLAFYGGIINDVGTDYISFPSPS
jgi:hypothetical protein